MELELIERPTTAISIGCDFQIARIGFQCFAHQDFRIGQDAQRVECGVILIQRIAAEFDIASRFKDQRSNVIAVCGGNVI